MRNPVLEKEVEALLLILPEEKRDAIYRYLWHQHVVVDVLSLAENKDIVLSKDEIDTVAEWFVYSGDYDCNLSYWDNIEALIERAIAQRA